MEDLRSKFLAAADAWAGACGAPESRLGKQVANDANFVKRARKRDVLPCTVGKLEEFAEFLADPANWPDGVVADEAKALAHVVGVSVPEGDAAEGRLSEVSPRSAAA